MVGKLLDQWQAMDIVKREEMLVVAINFILTSNPDRLDNDALTAINRMSGRMFEALSANDRAKAAHLLGKGLVTLVQLTEMYQGIAERDNERAKGSEDILDAIRVERRKPRR